jgi:hypothetical protein
MLANEGPLRHLHQISQEGRPNEERRYSRTRTRLRSELSATRATNGWMSTLESRAKPYLDAMLHGYGRAQHETGIRTLAAWALKTSMMVEHMHGAKRHVIPSEEYAHLFENHEPSECVHIWIAAYTGTQAAAVGGMWGLDVETNETGPREWEPDRGVRDIWGGTVLFGPVLFQLVGTTLVPLLEGVQDMPHTPASARTGGPSRGCPGRGSPTTN